MEKNELLVETIHALLCDLKHSGNMQDLMREREEGCCYFYLEKSFIEKWEMEDHAHWYKIANDIKNDLKAPSSEDALRSIYQVLDMIEKVNELSNEEYKLLLRFLNLKDNT